MFAGSEGQLKDLTNSPRKSAPNSAKSDIRKHKPLPPIGAATGESNIQFEDNHHQLSDKQ